MIIGLLSGLLGASDTDELNISVICEVVADTRSAYYNAYYCPNENWQVSPNLTEIIIVLETAYSCCEQIDFHDLIYSLKCTFSDRPTLLDRHETFFQWCLLVKST